MPQDVNVYNYADILVEGAFRAIECRLAQMNVFSRYCLTFSANDCVFSLNEQQKVYNSQMNVFSRYCLTFSANDCVFSLNEQQKVYNSK